ncbi:hypothetical protein BDN70DRAFT_818661, partial [Pholiota conissans]
LPFGDIFNLNAFRLEWRDVKQLPAPSGFANPYPTAEIEDIGCWTTRKESLSEPVRAEIIVRQLGVDASFTRVPVDVRFDPSTLQEDHIILPKVAALIYPLNPSVAPETLQALASSPNGHWLSPDKHLTCFDSLYYATSGSRQFEWEYSWAPAWRLVGRHLTFTDTMKELGRTYLRWAFNITDPWTSLDLPPFIAVHIRHGDFSNFSMSLLCQIFLENIAHDIMFDTHIPLLSDEISPSFWDDVRKRGWFHANHVEVQTLEIYGEWHPPLIDTIIQSLAIGFVGTEGSTYSLVSQRRVEDWNGGVVRIVDRAMPQISLQYK